MDRQQPSAAIAFSDSFKGLTNCSALCYANATMQVLLDLPEIRRVINDLHIDDPLRLFAGKYFASGNSRINPKQFYEKMEIVLPDGEQDDIESFLERLVSKYPAFKDIFGIEEAAIQNGVNTTETRTGMGIKCESNIQDGIDAVEKPEVLPSVLNVFIDRQAYTDQGVSTFSKNPIKINKSITINSKKYKLRSIIIHSGSYDSGHFRCIILRNSEFTLINDSRIYTVPPDDVTTEYVYKNVVMCTYIQCEESVAGFFDIEAFITREVHEVRSTEDDRPMREEGSLPKKDSSYHKNALFIQTANCDNLIDIPYELNEEELDDSWINNVHDHTIKTNLHDTYLYLHGFINASLDKGPTKDIKCAEPKYQKTFNKLEKIIKILGKCKFNYSQTIGEQNAETMADVLEIHAIVPSREQAKEAAARLKEYMAHIDENDIPPDEALENDITELLDSLIKRVKCEEDCYSIKPETIDQEEEEMFFSLNEHYNWKARADELDVELITETLIQLNDESEKKEETLDVTRRNMLREKLWNDFNRDLALHETKEKFVQDWVAKRNAGKLDNDLSFTVKYATRLINEFIENNGVVYQSI